MCCLASVGVFGHAGAACPELLDHSFETLDGKRRSLCEYAGKVVLVVNTASRCGFTPQYEGLEALYKRLQSRGLVVLGFPANDFGGQEPGSGKEIADFCQVNYGVSFPVFAKTSVVGPNANPLHQRLAKLAGEPPKWNFHKYLIDRNGTRVESFGSRTKPDDPAFTARIETLLNQK